MQTVKTSFKLENTTIAIILFPFMLLAVLGYFIKNNEIEANMYCPLSNTSVQCNQIETESR